MEKWLKHCPAQYPKQHSFHCGARITGRPKGQAKWGSWDVGAGQKHWLAVGKDIHVQNLKTYWGGYCCISSAEAQQNSSGDAETYSPFICPFLHWWGSLFTKVNWDKLNLVSDWLVQQICRGYLSIFPDWGYGCLRLLHHMIKLLPQYPEKKKQCKDVCFT